MADERSLIGPSPQTQDVIDIDIAHLTRGQKPAPEGT
jgi:hypothetical protein